MSRHRDRVDTLVQGYLEHAAAGGVASSEVFARYALSRGARVRIVHAGDGAGTQRQTWVRVLNDEGIHGYDVDVLAAGGPLVWWMNGRHPVTGEPRELRVQPAVDPA